MADDRYLLYAHNVALNPPALYEIVTVSSKSDRKRFLERVRQDQVASPTAKFLISEYRSNSPHLISYPLEDAQ